MIHSCCIIFIYFFVFFFFILWILLCGSDVYFYVYLIAIWKWLLWHHMCVLCTLPEDMRATFIFICTSTSTSILIYSVGKCIQPEPVYNFMKIFVYNCSGNVRTIPLPYRWYIQGNEYLSECVCVWQAGFLARESIYICVPYEYVAIKPRGFLFSGTNTIIVFICNVQHTSAKVCINKSQ